MNFDKFGQQLMAATMRAVAEPETLKKEVHRRLELERRNAPCVDMDVLRNRAADHFIARAGNLGAVCAGAASLPSVIPGAGTVARVATGFSEIAVTTKLKIEMAHRLALVYGHDLTNEVVRWAYTLAAVAESTEEKLVKAVTAGGKTWLEQAIKKNLKGALLKAVKEAFKKLGIRFTRSRLVSAIPFLIGPVVAVVIGKGSVYLLGRALKASFTKNTSSNPRLTEDAVIVG